MNKNRAKLVENNRLATDMNQLVFEVIGSPDWNFEEGQFVMVEKMIDEELVRRAYSVSSVSDDLPMMELTVKRIEGGLMSNYLCDLQSGDVVDFTGPHGVFGWRKGKQTNKVLVAIGCGLAPLKSILLKYIQKDDLTTKLFFGCRYADQVPYDELFSKLQDNYKNFEYFPCISRPDKDCKYCGRVGEVIEEVDLDYGNSDFFLCGNEEMIKQMIDLIIGKGGKKENIYHENIFPKLKMK
ncbi:FAD-dependent oxidoreductase, partial [Patescibacteria group bacterium]|nr:FAD-dependent oxidoreductase [Patescibacteria group bacterium]